MEGDNDKGISCAGDEDYLAAYEHYGVKYHTLNEEVLLKLQRNDHSVVSLKIYDYVRVRTKGVGHAIGQSNVLKTLYVNTNVNENEENYELCQGLLYNQSIECIHWVIIGDGDWVMGDSNKRPVPAWVNTDSLRMLSPFFSNILNLQNINITNFSDDQPQTSSTGICRDPLLVVQIYCFFEMHKSYRSNK